MSKYDIIITLFTILYGLMLTDLFLSFHKLIRNRKTVTWHWLPLLTAWYLFLTILKNWWGLSPHMSDTTSINVYLFVLYAHLLFLLFLMVSAALPDSVEQGHIDLKSYYFNNHQYFWGLMTAVMGLSIVITFIRQFHQLNFAHILPFLSVFVLPALTLTLAISKRYWTHAIILLILVSGILIELAR